MKKFLLFTFILLPTLLFSSPGWKPMEQITDNRVMDMMPWIDIKPNGQPVIAAHEIIPDKKYDIFVTEQKNGTWESTNVTNTPMVSDYQAVIKSDSKGNLHVFYLSRLESKNNKLFLFYTGRINGTWTTPTCLTISKQGNTAESRPAVAIDSKDNINVVVPDDNGNLIYLEKDSTGWKPFEFITVTTDSINWYPSIVTDRENNLHVIYLGGNDPDYSIKYIQKNSEGWTKPQLVVDSTWSCWHPSLAISLRMIGYLKEGVIPPNRGSISTDKFYDLGETLNISFACGSPLHRNIAYVKGGPYENNVGKEAHGLPLLGINKDWSKPILLTSNDADYDYPSITLDRMDRPHIVFHGGVGGNDGNYKIYYTNNITNNFSKPIALTNDNIYQYNPVIVMDKDGYGYITYYGFDGYDTELFLQKSEKPLDQLTNLSGQQVYRNFPDHKKRYLPPVDLNYIPSGATTLNGKKITISAGHGGWAYLSEYRYGATNSREGDFNFQVADDLRQYLEKCGVTVYMCRTTDMDIPLNDRPGLANSTNSDLFISIHHNASDFYTNYASVYYHADPDYDPVSLDIARYADKEIAELLNIPDQGVMSDYYSFWNAGYAELRGLKGRPGILGEGSHFYCFEEEEQLRNLDYLKREAYAYFLGLIKYYSSEHPTATLLEPAGISTTSRPRIKIQLNNGANDTLHKIIPSSIQLKLDGKQILFDYDWRNGLLTYQPKENLTPGDHTLELLFTNFDKITSGKTFLTFKISP